MGEADIVVPFYSAVGVIVVTVALWIEWRARKRSRAEVAHEIQHRLLDEDAMSAAMVAGEADRDATRSHYIRQRVSEHKRAYRKASYWRIGRTLLAVFVVIAVAGTLYNLVDRVQGLLGAG